jgi:hypothetical protein
MSKQINAFVEVVSLTWGILLSQIGIETPNRFSHLLRASMFVVRMGVCVCAYARVCASDPVCVHVLPPHGLARQ